MDGTVLIADDDRTIRTVLTQALTRAGCKVHATSSLTTLLRWVEEGKGDVVISDVVMPDGNGIEMLPRIKQLRPGLPVIVISAQNTIMTAIQATEAEAWDYLPKPFDLPDLIKRVGKGITLGSQSRGASAARPPASPARPSPARGLEILEPGVNDLPLVGRTPAMQALYRLIARVMNTDMAVLIAGESGTGKSLIARALHDLSDRRGRPFVVTSALDFAQGDTQTGMALLARVKSGTLVIDGLGDLDASAQGRLVRLLDVIESTADDAPRVVAIAGEDVADVMEAGQLRRDLFFRLGAVTLDVPPLRERIEDFAPLCEHFLARAAREGWAERVFSTQALEMVRHHPWPGNVRQLENTVRRLVATGQGAEIGVAELEAVLRLQPAAVPNESGLRGETLSDSVARHIRRYFDLHGGELPPAGLYDRVLHEIEAPLIDIALEFTGGNQARCADLLGINRNTLRKKITDLDIRVTRRRKLM
jgi:two-component system nitrogen regulation response regulator GlnG